MKTIWIQMLEYAIRGVIGIDFNIIKARVIGLLNSNMSGLEKRAYVIECAREAGSTASKFLLKIAVEYALGKIEQELENTK